jgi:hypothetical protein
LPAVKVSKEALVLPETL